MKMGTIASLWRYDSMAERAALIKLICDGLRLYAALREARRNSFHHWMGAWDDRADITPSRRPSARDRLSRPLHRGSPFTQGAS